MRRAYLAAAVVIIVAAAVAYSALSASVIQGGPAPVEVGPPDLASLPVVSASEIESAVIPREIADSNNAFAADFYRQVSGEEGNIFFSPLSMYTAFSLLYEGASGDAVAELEDAFGFEPDARARHNATAHAIASINRDDPHAELALANSLWPFVGDVVPEYLNVARSTYLATIEDPGYNESAENRGDEPARRINQWTSDMTNGTITGIFGPNSFPDPILVIVNAVYFKGTWETQFPPEDTEKNDWHGEGDAEADYMNVVGAFDYAEYDGLQVLRMPYEGDRLSMTVVLPEPGGMKELEESISAEQMAVWTDGTSKIIVDVTMPKFTASTKYSLNNYLKALGVSQIFEPGPNVPLAGIYHGAVVGRADHMAFVDVNEEGTEAAAVSAALVASVSVQPPPPQFKADRPFLFLIQDDESGAVLFMGRVSEP
ncbi:serine protease inhibitor [Cenarchaeum symbiosum A]|uniref:Serine protease inhibitor n=1 Tax=Cenarchaeum symbiosum (strain A) TaxID=414004 RepID=A0RY08_CENSY|nr:serine protease inhibitor [Cenarchaeum symbiosum A]